MPWKRPLCGRKDEDGTRADCYWTNKDFVKWLQEYKGWAKDEFHRGQYWKAEYRCPKCGNTQTAVKMRTNRQLKNAGIIV